MNDRRERTPSTAGETAMNNRRDRAFTIIELLVVVSIIALLVSVLLPAIGKARDQGLVTQSASNLRNLFAAHFRYANEWNDKQFTLIEANMSYLGDDEQTAFSEYQQVHGVVHPRIWLGWGHEDGDSTAGFYHWYLASALLGAYQPFSFTSDSGSGGERFGSFRLLNVEAFHTYLSGKFYEPIFYAPKDEIALETVRGGFESPDSFHAFGGYGNLQWSTYCLSPAAMYHPSVFRRVEEGGFQDPWSIAGGFRSPSLAQSTYPSLKTHFAEHHWLQNRRSDCNPAFDGGTYDGCEPYYFNHSRESSPMTVFYDGHTASIGVREAMQADARMRNQTNDQDGLWSIDTTCFHILTTDGIKGRDMFSR
jgi:prepilin-type N-terminal cleavage/methylation domain-containing protein